MTYGNIIKRVGRIARRNLNDTKPGGDVEFVREAVDSAIQEIAEYRQWWFLYEEFKIDLVTDQRLYDFPSGQCVRRRGGCGVV